MLDTLHNLLLSGLTKFFEWAFGNLTDSSFWLGLGTSVLILLIFALRGASSALGSHFGRVILGMWYDSRRDHRDIINITFYFWVMNEVNQLRFKVDSIVGDHPITTVFCNPFVAMRVRWATFTTKPNQPLVRLWLPRKRSRQTKRRQAMRKAILRSVRLGKLAQPPTLAAIRRRVQQRYDAIYDPLVAMIAEHFTNEGAKLAAEGVECREVRYIVFLTYPIYAKSLGRIQHTRVALVREDDLLLMGEELPSASNRALTHRYAVIWQLSQVIRGYRGGPKRWGILEGFIPKHDLNGAIPALQRAQA